MNNTDIIDRTISFVKEKKLKMPKVPWLFLQKESKKCKLLIAKEEVCNETIVN
jgi:hypothetical protein